MFKVALRVCERRLKDLDEMIDDPTAFQGIISDQEWAVISADELNAETLAAKKHADWIAKNDALHNGKKQ